MGGYTVMQTAVFSNIAGDLQIEVSTRSTGFQFLSSVSVPADKWTSLEADITPGYARSIFKNGLTAQTSFYHFDLLKLWP